MDFSEWFDRDKIAETFNKVKNAMMQLTEYQGKVMDATNNDHWGASSTLMTDIANATNHYQHFGEIMEIIYKRLQEKPSPTWRQTYKALQLLEYLIKNGSEKVIDNARDHIYELKALKNFHYTDEKGKDQGINVRQRANEIMELLGDNNKIKEERRKARENKNKYTGVSSTGMGSGANSRFGGFGSNDSYRGDSSGGYSGGGYSDNNNRSYSSNTSPQKDRFENSATSSGITAASETTPAPKTKLVIRMTGETSGSSSTSTANPVKSVTSETKKTSAPATNLLDLGGGGDDWADFSSAPITNTSANSQQQPKATITPVSATSNFADFASFQSPPPSKPSVQNTMTAPPVPFAAFGTPAPVQHSTANFASFPPPQNVNNNFANFSQPMAANTNLMGASLMNTSQIKPASSGTADLLGGIGGLNLSSAPLVANSANSARANQPIQQQQTSSDAFSKLVSLDANALSGLGMKKETPGTTASLNTIQHNNTNNMAMNMGVPGGNSSYMMTSSMKPLNPIMTNSTQRSTGLSSPISPTQPQHQNSQQQQFANFGFNGNGQQQQSLF